MTLLDTLYCEEENYHWEEDEELEAESYCHPVLLEQDLLWEDEELSSLLSREAQQNQPSNCGSNGGSFAGHRREAVELILDVVSRYSFTALTAVLAVNYLDRFLDRFDGFECQKRKPWMTQLAAVSCLSLAAKVEETHVPLLLDLQVAESKYVFEAKTIQKMELLILSTLQWRMNPVTPISFLDYITRRLGLKNNLSLEFLRRCECLLLCFLPDCGFRCYLPSVIATATMVHVINSVEPCIGIEYQSQLLGILGIDKGKVEECSKRIKEMSWIRDSGRHFNKRKFGSVPGSPNGVMDLSFSSDCSNESWIVTTNTNANPSVSSSPDPLAKKSRKGAP